MFREHPHVRQIPGETRRRWFSSEDMDLIVWQEPGGPMKGFQLTYPAGPDEERVLTWKDGKGYWHERLDNGEGRGLNFKMSPILLPDGIFDRDGVTARFRSEAASMDKDISREVIRRLQEYD